MEYFALAAFGLLGYFYLNQNFDENGLKVDNASENTTVGDSLRPDVTTYKNPAPKEKVQMFNYSEMGISYDVGRPLSLNLANLNEAYKPRTAPTQKSTFDLVDIFQDQAKTVSYLEATGNPFYFNKRHGEIPDMTAQQSNPLIEIPGRSSIKGDPKKTLVYYPRVYIQNGEEVQKKTSERYDKMLDSGMPEESEKKYVPLTGKLTREWNPWGNGGKLNRVFTNRQGWESERRQADRSVLMQPVYGHRLMDF